MHTPTTTVFSLRQPLLRSAIACAALLAATATTGAIAQTLVTATASPTPPASTANAPAPAGRTRAEVVAELACARASGELDAAVLRSYGLDMATAQPRAGTPCSPAGGTALAGQPERGTTP